MSVSSPIIVVTGANGGVGFGICQRLLFQLSQTNPPDAQPRFNHVAGVVRTLDDLTTTSRCEGLTLIMACRSETKADAARKQLYQLLDGHIQKQKNLKEYDGHADIFRKNLKIEIHCLDLANMRSIFQFANELRKKYQYISHLICNAGGASFLGIDWLEALAQLAREPIEAVTSPGFYRQRWGELSADGLGWVWQFNVFGHYALYRALQPLLLASQSSLRSRVIWMSSLEAGRHNYDVEDWQLVKTEHPYECSKYQVDLLSAHLDRLASKEPSGTKGIRHFVVEPGVTSTALMDTMAGGWFLTTLRVLTFYLARFFGSPHHNIVGFNAAIAAVHLAIVSFCFIPTYSPPSSNNRLHPPDDRSVKAPSSPVKFGSQTGRWGDGRIGLIKIKEWEKNEAQGAQLLENCEVLYQSFLKREGGGILTTGGAPIGRRFVS